MFNEPIAFFITFTTYGKWLHGDERNSIVVEDGGTKIIGGNNCLKQSVTDRMTRDVVVFDKAQRQIVLDTIIEHCRIKGWKLFAAHVRSNHVHIVVKAGCEADKVMRDIKAWATRKLRYNGHEFEKVWTRGGSTKFIFTEDKLKEKVRYVVYEQGEMMEWFSGFVG